jgi:hypothetical protein
MLPILWGLPLLATSSLAQGTPAPIVDLGYAKYQGLYNATYDQNTFKGYVVRLHDAEDNI